MEFSCTIWYAHQKITFDDTSVQTSVGRVNRRLTACCLLLDICCDENKYCLYHSHTSNWKSRRVDSRGDLVISVLGKFTNPKIGNHCCDMIGHVFHSVLLHLPCILFETTLIFTLGFSSLILYDLIFQWRHKGKMVFLNPLCVLRTF